MFISDAAIRRPIVTIVTMIALVSLGAFALMQLELDEYPDVTNPIVAVTVPYPGASPGTVEREVVDRLEEAIAGIDGVDRLQSTSRDGLASLIVFFVFEKNIDQAAQDIRDAISAIRGDLPPEMEEPIISRFDPAELPIVSLVLTSPRLTQGQLTAIADPMITRELRSVPGVAEVRLIGGAERELTVELRPQDLKGAGVSVADVVFALQSQNLAAPVGRVTSGTMERSIRLEGRLGDPEDFERLVVAERGGRIIRLGQIADVRDGTEEPRSSAIYDGRPAIGIDVVKTKGTSTTTVADAIKERVAVLSERLPEETELVVVKDAGYRVEASVHNVQRMLMEGAALTVAVVFLFLNSWRSTVITGLALPISVLSSFIAVWAFGFTLNVMSLLGLSLAIGVLIDDAIVVRENIVRHMQLGKHHFKAAHDGTDEIGLAVTATTFAIVAVFVPVGFMSGEMGQWFKPMALTIACAVLVSLFVSFSLDPMLSAYWSDPQIEAGERGNRLARLLNRFNVWFEGIADRYKNVIGWALDHRLAVVSIAGVAMVGALVIQVMFGGFGFVPDADRGEINVTVETPPGSNLEYTEIKAEEVARIMRARPEVAHTYVTVGAASTESLSSGSGVDAASIYVKLADRDQRDLNQYELAGIIREEIRMVGGAQAVVYSAGWGADKSFQLDLRGPDAATLTALAEQVADIVRTVPNAVDVGLSTRGQKPELNVEIERGVAGSLGITAGQIAQALRPAFAGLDAGDWVDPDGETRDVMVRLAPEARERAQDIRQLPLVLPGAPGEPPSIIPLEQVASVEMSLGPAQIDHLDRERVITIGANTQGRSLGEVSRDVEAALAGLQLPPGYRLSPGGMYEQQNEAFISMFAALGFAVLLMYLILVVQFGSFLDPIGILLSLPLSLIGVVLALLLTGTTLNLMSMIGVMLLMGLVAKNAILLIDFAKWGREAGMERREAIIEAGRTRLRPIVMTSFALIAGMTPVAIGAGEGGDFNSPMGRAVIGGVITSTLLTLLVIPTVYEILDEWKEWFMLKVLGRKPRLGHAAGGLAAEAGD